MDNSPTKVLYTPRRAQKCLFAPINDKSAKRSASQGLERIRDDKCSGDESDLGPMSPLALTDRSPSTSDLSSSGREFVSPLASPEKSIIYSSVSSVSWDRLRFSMEERMSPFRSLRKVTRAARYSPRCKLFTNNDYQRSLSFTPEKVPVPLTPQRSKTMDAEQTNEIVPETPQRSFATEIQNQCIIETPKKGRTPESKQITPLSSVSKTVPLPKLHRRKSLSMIETSVGFSPEQKENTLKRHARDQSGAKPTKLFKEDDGFTPRARASLFQERKHECSSLKNFSLSTKTFYSSNVKSERPFGKFRNSDIKSRRSLPSQSSSRRSLGRKRRFGKINAGVGHGIKKPKLKVNTEALKNDGEHVTQNLTAPSNSPPTEEAQPMEVNAIAQRAPSPTVDENKRFFKTNKTIRLNQAATVTVNDKIKLKVADGKIELRENQKCISTYTNARKQKLRAMDAPLDATDLTVDEPEVEATLQQDKVADLLKILENDWANDDYDTMAPLTHIANVFSPLKPAMTLSEDTIMSPATELSNMTSTMNIKDAAPLKNFGNLSLETANNNDTEKTDEKDTEKRYFPLFTKGYSVPDDIFEETSNANTTKAKRNNTQWQLSMKNGCGGAEDQYQLDAGQKRFGATQCPECNIVYQLGDPEDENAHLNYHNSIRTLKFQGWKNERVILEDTFTSSKIILVEPCDSKQHWKKVLEILSVVDRDLGLADISNYQNKKIFLYIRDKNVLGVLVAEHIETAFRMIPELIELNCCTAESTPTKCGINVVWTAMSHRKQGIATKLVDTLRAQFFYGYVMSLDDIAFSIPTPGGKIFAEKYTRMKNFKVYN